MIRVILIAILLIPVLGKMVSSYEMKPSRAAEYFEGDHLLRKMRTSVSQEERSSGSLFFVFGGFKSTSKQVTTVQFAWQLNSGEYTISTLPIDKVRILPKEDTVTPSVSFSWKRCNSLDLSWQMENCIHYAVFTVSPEDWPIDVQVPLNE